MDTQTDIETGVDAESPENAAVSMDAGADILPTDAERDAEINVFGLPRGWRQCSHDPEARIRYVGVRQLQVFRRRDDGYWLPIVDRTGGPDCTSREVAMREAERLAAQMIAAELSDLATGDLPAGVTIVEANAAHEAGAVLRLHGRVVVLDRDACIRVAAKLLALATREPSRPEECQGCSGAPYCAECQETLREVVYG